MASNELLQSDLSPLQACTISRDVQNFDLLIEDMETALGENWGDLGFAEAKAFFGQAEAEGLEFVAIAIDDSVLGADNFPDPAALDLIGRMGGNTYARTTDRFDLERPS